MRTMISEHSEWKQNEIRHHDLIAGIYDQATLRAYSFFRHIIEKRIEELRNRGAKLILDCGCGTGKATFLSVRKGLKIISLDISLEMVKRVREKQRLLGLRAEKIFLVVADAEKLPFKTRVFDGIISIDIFHHLPSINKALEEQIYALNKEGSLLIGDLNNAGPFFRGIKKLKHKFSKITKPIFRKNNEDIPSYNLLSPNEYDISSKDILNRFDMLNMAYSINYFLHIYFLDRFFPNRLAYPILRFFNRLNFTKKGNVFIIQARQQITPQMGTQ